MSALPVVLAVPSWCHPRLSLASLGVLGGSIFFCTSSTAAIAQAALPIDLEVAVEQSAPFGAMHEWGQLLNEMDLSRVRLRGAYSGDVPTVTSTGEGAAQRFKLVGMLNRRDQLVLPGGTFGHGDRVKLKAYFEGVPERVAEKGVERGIFNLTKQQFEQVYEELSTPVTMSTKGQRPEAIFTALTAGLAIPMEIDPSALGALRAAPAVEAELREFSAGTAIAISLRPAELTLLPEQKFGQPLKYRVVKASSQQRGWPAGWKPAQTARELSPAMYEFRNIEIGGGFMLGEALDAFAPRMGMPLLFDERVLATRNIDPGKIEVNLPRGKTYIRRAVDRLLSQARLAGEVRVDENEKPFYWITQFGPDNLPAKSPK